MDASFVPGTRGQSTVLGFALLLGITIVGATAAVVLGGAALSDMQHSAETARAENAFSIMDGRISLVALGGSTVQTVDLGLNTGRTGATIEARDSGWMRVTYINTSSGGRTVVANETLGAIVYTNDDVSVVYQGGGVWRHANNGSVMVSPPEFHYRDGTLTFPLVTVDGERSLTNRIVITRNGTTTQRYPNTTRQANYSNPVPQNIKVEVTVDSRYYQGWGRYFEQRTSGAVRYDHGREQATVTLIHPLPNVESAITAVGGGGGQLQIQNQVNVSSYNSSDPSPTFGGSNGNIVTNLDVVLEDQVNISGNLTTSGTADISGLGGSGRIRGYLAYGSGSVDSNKCDTHVDEWCAANASLGSYTTVDSRIDSRIERIEQTNDNVDEPHITNGELDWSSTDDITLDAGDYYFNTSFQVQGSNSNPQNLTLNTSGGDIEIAVDDVDMQVLQHGNITVEGDGVVRFYNDKQIQVQDQANIWVPGYDAPQMWMYCTSDCQIYVNDSARLVGVLYAPSEAGAGGQVVIQNHAGVYGALVSGRPQIRNHAVVHYDEALADEDVFPSRPPVIYMHVTTNRVNVSSR